MQGDGTSFALIAHDLKNALGGLEAELDALCHAPSSLGAQQALSHCAELRRQFVQFLTVYRTGELKALCEDESPTQVLESFLQGVLAKKRKSHEHLQIEMAHLHDVPSFWYLDNRLVHLALDAALHNACRFAQKRITLGVRQEGSFLVFTVTDDGPGLGSEDESPASTGLGTQLCTSVAAAHHCREHHGFVRLFTRPEGGTSFEMWLP